MQGVFVHLCQLFLEASIDGYVPWREMNIGQPSLGEGRVLYGDSFFT